MIRLVAIPAIILTVLFSALMSFIPSFAPETSALGYYELTADRGQAIYLLDARSGLSYFTGLVTRPGNYSLWSADGQTIATVRVNSTSESLDIFDLSTGEYQYYPLQSPAGTLIWDTHPTKIAYQSLLNDGSLMIYDRETGEERNFWENVNIRWMRWIPESDTLLVLSAEKRSQTSTLYAIDLTTNDITLLEDDLQSVRLDVVESPTRILYTNGNQVLIRSAGALNEREVLMTLDDGEIRYMYPLNAATNTWVVYTTLNETWQMNVQTGDLQRMGEAPEGSDSWSVYPSSDGSTLATLDRVSDTSSIIYVTDENGQASGISVNDSIAGLIWSPAGRYLLAPTPSEGYITTVYLVDTRNGNYEVAEQVFLNLFWQPSPE
ncbi:MAG: hypothetical protein RLP44_18570 [Aggregatilineales bacterium]